LGGLWFQASLGNKEKQLCEIPSQGKKSWEWWLMPVISVMAGSIKQEKHSSG
jgi:hypothetical protein